MARTKQIKKPCDLCGREIVSSAMHQHLRKCRKDHETADQTQTTPPTEKSPNEQTMETARNEIILFTEPVKGTQTTANGEKKDEGGFSYLARTVADFIKEHPDEIMPIIATGAAIAFPQLAQQMNPSESQAVAVEDKRTWAEKGHW